MSERREVRVADSFFARLDEQFGTERGPSGEPSATDFIVIDLPAIVELFATTFDDLPEAIPGLPRSGCSSARARSHVPTSCRESRSTMGSSNSSASTSTPSVGDCSRSGGSVQRDLRRP